MDYFGYDIKESHFDIVTKHKYIINLYQFYVHLILFRGNLDTPREANRLY